MPGEVPGTAADRHGKVLFTVTELANAAGTSRAALNVELARLRRQEIIAKYAHGLYGLPEPYRCSLGPGNRLARIHHRPLRALRIRPCDPGAVTITCFTDRRSPRARERATPLGRLVFVCVRSGVYFPAVRRGDCSSSQALCDYVYLSRRQGTPPEALVTFRNLSRVRDVDFLRILARYPTPACRST